LKKYHHAFYWLSIRKNVIITCNVAVTVCGSYALKENFILNEKKCV